MRNSPIPTETLAAWLGRQRWFAGKGRAWRVVGTQTLAELEADPSVRIDVVTVAYDDGAREHELYQVPLLLLDTPSEALSHALVGEDGDEGHGRRWVYDALHAREVTGLWLRGIAEEQSLESPDASGGGVRFRADPTAAAIPLGATSMVLGGEQSNTSLVFGDLAMLKIFRKLTPGLNPDIELHTTLARAGSRHIAAPLGWIEGSWQEPQRDPERGEVEVEGSLGMLQQFLRNAADGWDQALTSVRDLLAEGDLHADEVGGDFAAESYRLGVATAEVHADLARTLPTELAGPDTLAALAGGMRGRLEAAAAAVPALAPYADGLRATYDELAGYSAPVRLQRIHGDLHLGQVMRTPDGWKLLDFEGEPAKPLQERRALDAPVRDVAGMLRSFDYASRQLLADTRTDPQREYRAAEWADRNREAYCDGYAKASGADPRADQVLLRAYETDKAVYEVVYETRNRPSWVRVPMLAIERLAGASRRRTR